MQTGARYQAVYEILNEVFKDDMPADAIINNYLRERKYIGSKDRRFISELVWNIIRNRMKLEFDARSNDVRKILLWALRDKLDEVFDGSKYGMSALTQEEKLWLEQDNDEPYPDYVEAECPKWIFEQIKDIEFCKALNRPAKANFRVHGHCRDEVLERLRKEGFDAFPTSLSPLGIEVEQRISLGNCVCYQEGLLEVQDEASQIAALLCDANENHKIIDYCCGAGGKSLALSALLNNRGNILAHDISSKRLEAIKPRMSRLGVKNIELTDIVADSDKDFDRFIIDAPCSGSGTWRRSPDAKFRLTPKYLEKLIRTQSEILEYAAPKVKEGGRIVYITCSVFQKENDDVICAFLQNHSDFRVLNIVELWEKILKIPYPVKNENMLKFSPMSTNTDGFFVCVLEKQKNNNL